jgi:putative oxidoreductase
MVRQLLETNGSMAGLILRVALAAVIFPHGAQKLLGWFGGHGFRGTMGYFTQSMKIPGIFALAAILTEFFAPVALVAGFATRPAAALVGVVMLVAVMTVARKFGFFMNWNGTKAGEGIEYHILALGIVLALLVLGGGAASVDGWLAASLR